MNPISITIRSGRADATGTFAVDGGAAARGKRVHDRTGYATQKILSAFYESAEKGRLVAL